MSIQAVEMTGLDTVETAARCDRHVLVQPEGSPRSRTRKSSGKGVGPEHRLHALVEGPERAPLERLAKGQELVVRDNVQRIHGGLTLLQRGGDIDQAQCDAAERWYRDYVMGVIGARDPEGQRSGKAPDVHAAMLARTAAIGRCRAVRHGLGLCGEMRLKMLLIDELSFSTIAKRIIPDDINGRKKIAAQMTFLLEQLAELYLLIDRPRLPDRSADHRN